MSTQAVCRPRAESPLLTARRIDDEAWFDTGAREAILALDGGQFARWTNVWPAGCEWDDLVNEVSGFGPPPVGSRLEAALLAMAQCSTECVVWYPGDDFGTIPIVQDEYEFAARITEAVARGNIEPQLRFVGIRPPSESHFAGTDLPVPWL